MSEQLEQILERVKHNPAELKPFSKDTYQLDPLGRMKSIAEILSALQLPPGSKVMDLGTGYGYGAVVLHALGYKVMGIDSNTAKLDTGLEYWDNIGVDFKVVTDAAQAFDGELCFLHRDARNLQDIPDNHLDAVTSFYFSGYMMGKHGAYKEAGRIVRHGGTVVISTQGHDPVPRWLRWPVVNLMSYFYVPPRLKIRKRMKLSADKAYDRFVFVLGK